MSFRGCRLRTLDLFFTHPFCCATMEVHPKHPLMPHEEIDHYIDGICQEFGSLSDAFDFPEGHNFEESSNGNNQFPENYNFDLPPDSEVCGTFRPGSGRGTLVNMYPANARAACTPHFLMVLPADPFRGNRKLTPHERQRRTVLYFQNALRSLHRWAAICGGDDALLLTEQWPIAPNLTESHLWGNTLGVLGVQIEDWIAVRIAVMHILERQAHSIPESKDSLELERFSRQFTSWKGAELPNRQQVVDLLNSAGMSRDLRKRVRKLLTLLLSSGGPIDPALTFHDNLNAFREMHPNVNFHIRLAAMPNQKPVRFRFLSGEVWPRI